MPNIDTSNAVTKSRIKAQADELTAKVDEVIALLPAKVDEVINIVKDEAKKKQ